MPLFAKERVKQFERKGYNKVTTISLKKHNFIRVYYQTRLQEETTCLAGNFKRTNAEKAFFFSDIKLARSQKNPVNICFFVFFSPSK